MALLDQDQQPESRRGSELLPTIAGFLAAAVVAGLGSLPRVRSLSGVDIIASVLCRALGVFAACTVTVWTFLAVRTGMRAFAALQHALASSVPAIWFVPLALLIREHSTWALAIAAAFSVSTTRLWCSREGQSSLEDRQEHDVSGAAAELALESSGSSRQQVRAIGAAFCAQSGAVLSLAGYAFTGAVLAGIGSGLWSRSYAEAIPATRLSSASLRSLWALAIAIPCASLALMPYLRSPYFLGGFGVSGRHYSHRGFAQREQIARGSAPPFRDSAGRAEDGEPGVILWPPEQKHMKLVAPSPALGASLLRSTGSADPLVIPFDGVYWFFKAPDKHPPKNSQEARGSPESFNIHSTDRRPLTMEAHENLGAALDLNCCNKIQIAIRNRDRYPETVALELVLSDTTSPGRPSESLGRMTVKSTPPWDLYAKRPPTTETLNFTIPSKRRLSRFDQVTIVFWLDAARSDDAAQIAVDRLVLVPRGL